MGQGMSPVALCLVSDPSFLPFVCQTGQRILIWASLTLFLIGRILFVNKRFHLFQRSQEGVTPSIMNIPVVCYLYQYSYLVFCLMFSHKMVAGNIDARFSHESPPISVFVWSAITSISRRRKHKLSKEANKTEDLNNNRIENNNSDFVKKRENNYVELIW